MLASVILAIVGGGFTTASAVAAIAENRKYVTKYTADCANGYVNKLDKYVQDAGIGDEVTSDDSAEWYPPQSDED